MQNINVLTKLDFYKLVDAGMYKYTKPVKSETKIILGKPWTMFVFQVSNEIANKFNI